MEKLHEEHNVVLKQWSIVCVIMRRCTEEYEMTVVMFSVKITLSQFFKSSLI